MPLCTDRERRPNAGSRMAKLLNEEEEDEFYTSVYGGFTEEAEDMDYESESSVEDIIDSDFDVSSEGEEEDGAGSDNSEENEKRKSRSKRVITKGYKEPKRSKPSDTVKESVSSDGSAAMPAKVNRTSEKSRSTQIATDMSFEPRTLRQSTIKATAATDAVAEARRKSSLNNTEVRREAMLAEIAQRKNVPEVRRLTQEELLAEAKLTEEINRRSLARYQRLEIEKKKARIQKTVHSTPMIRYHSFTVPLMEEQPDMYGVAMDTENSTIRAAPVIADRGARCSRNLITFADSAVLRAAMPQTATPLPEPDAVAPSPPLRPHRRTRICPITGLPARYLDPITLTPYANLAAFRVLRRLYAIHLETNAAPIDLLREYRIGNISVDPA